MQSNDKAKKEKQMHLVQLIHSKSVQARMMASRQNPQYLEYPFASSGFNLYELKSDDFNS